MRTTVITEVYIGTEDLGGGEGGGLLLQTAGRTPKSRPASKIRETIRSGGGGGGGRGEGSFAPFLTRRKRVNVY
jgi:hypothetical protein